MRLFLGLLICSIALPACSLVSGESRSEAAFVQAVNSLSRAINEYTASNNAFFEANRPTAKNVADLQRIADDIESALEELRLARAEVDLPPQSSGDLPSSQTIDDLISSFTDWIYVTKIDLAAAEDCQLEFAYDACLAQRSYSANNVAETEEITRRLYGALQRLMSEVS